MAGEVPNKIIYGNRTLLDLSGDTVTPDDVTIGLTFHLADGKPSTGTLADGNNIGYGLTDGTLPLAGVAKVGQAEI